jgi:hypothetical protein
MQLSKHTCDCIILTATRRTTGLEKQRISLLGGFGGFNGWVYK